MAPASSSRRKEEQSSASRACRCIRVFLGHLFSNLGLFAIVVGYVLLGALMFEALEAEYELQQRGNIKRYRDDCLKELWLITEKLNVLYEQNWTQLVHEQLRRFETNVVAAAKLEGYDGKDVFDAERQWSFSGALLYSVTVITTIGYGNLAPKTPAGKILTIVYAVFGVPLMLLCLSNLGQLLANAFQFAYSHMCCSRRRPKRSQRHRHARAAPTSAPASTSPELVPIPPPEQFKRLPPPPPPRLTPLKPRVLPPEARQLLLECAEYSVSQGAEPQALLTDLRRTPKEPSVEELLCAQRLNSWLSTPSKQPLLQSSPSASLSAASTSAPPSQPEVAPPSPCSEASSEERTRVPVCLVLVVLSGYICLGAAVFAAWEDWSLLDGAYFCFITLSTIGFGDLVPGKSFQRAADPQGGQIQLVVCCAYLLMGLVLIATAFSLVQEEVIFKCRKFARVIGIISKK